jgi:hypothetical protein
MLSQSGYISSWLVVIVIGVVATLGWAVIEGVIWLFQNVSIHIN